MRFRFAATAETFSAKWRVVVLGVVVLCGELGECRGSYGGPDSRQIEARNAEAIALGMRVSYTVCHICIHLGANLFRPFA